MVFLMEKGGCRMAACVGAACFMADVSGVAGSPRCRFRGWPGEEIGRALCPSAWFFSALPLTSCGDCGILPTNWRLNRDKERTG